MITLFKTKHWESKFWKLKAIFRAMRFAYKHPRHVQIAVSLDSGEFKMQSNYSGLNELGHMRVLKEVGKEVETMEMTEKEFKNMIN